MKRRQRQARSVLVNILVLICAVSVLITGVAAQNQPSQSSAYQGQGVTLTIKYQLFAGFKDPIHICVGEEKRIVVRLYRSMAPPDTQKDALPFRPRPGAILVGASANYQIAKVLIDQEITVDLLNGDAYAIFLVKGVSSGTTKLTFWADHTGDPLEWGNPKSIQLNVEVSDCYEAYASGLVTGNVANVWIKKNICDLKKSFTLKYRGAAQGGGAADKIEAVSSHFSGADPNNRLLTGYDGAYITIEKHVLTLSGRSFICYMLGGGGYTIEWKNSSKTEGDIVLEGGQRNTCDPLGPVFNADLRIAFRFFDQYRSDEVCE